MGRVERGLISFHPSPVYESASSGFLGDLEFMVLAYYVNSGLDSDYLSAIAKSVGADVRNVHHSIKKLVRRGFVERVRRGLYRITEAGKQAVHKLPVRRLSKLSRWTSVRNCDGTGGAAAVAKALPSGRPCYGGTFYDNVRYYVSGKPCRTRRDQLMRLEDLSVADSVSYCEVMHRVENLVVDGIVVVYTNPEENLSDRIERRGIPCWPCIYVYRESKR